MLPAVRLYPIIKDENIFYAAQSRYEVVIECFNRSLSTLFALWLIGGNNCYLMLMVGIVSFKAVDDSLRLFLGVTHVLCVVAWVVRRHKRESCLCPVLLVHHRQRKVSVSASSEV